MSDVVDVLIGLGSNIEAKSNTAKAICCLRDRFDLVATSTFYTSEPVGRLDQPAFINGVVRLQTPLTASELKAQLLAIEAELGRIRDPNDKCGPRTIDLDIIAYGDQAIDDLQIPDPNLEARWFVTIPAAELWPDWQHPITSLSLTAIAEPMRGKIDGHPVDLADCDM